MQFKQLLSYILIGILSMPSVHCAETAPYTNRVTSSLQAAKENLKQALKTFREDINDPRDDDELQRDLAAAKTWQEKRKILRVILNIGIARMALALGVSATVFFTYYMILKLGIIKPSLPTIAIPDKKVRSKLSYLNQNKEKFDIFTILGLNQNASLPDIKKAYKQLSLRYHPDKNPPLEQAIYAETFKIIGEAYKKAEDYKKVQ